MVYKILRYVIALLVGIMGYMLTDTFMPVWEPIIDVKFWTMGFFGISVIKILALALGGVIGALIGFVIALPIIDQGLKLAKNIERILSRVPNQELMAGTAGLLFGLIIANLIGLAFYRVPIIGSYIPIILSAIFGYIGMRLASRKGPELYANWLQSRTVAKDKKKEATPKEVEQVTAPVVSEFESVLFGWAFGCAFIRIGRITTYFRLGRCVKTQSRSSRSRHFAKHATKRVNCY